MSGYKIDAQPLSAGSTATTVQAAAPGADQSLPDPTSNARLALFLLVLGAALLAVVLNAAGATSDTFTPKKGDANFSILAGFYVGAQVIERLMEIAVPLLPAWPGSATGDAKVAQIKADRSKVALGVAGVLGVGVSAGFGLFFLEAIGIHASNTVDSLATGLVIAAGTKPLHDFISLLQNRSNPTTGKTAT